MDLLRRHMFLLICGVAGALGVVLALTGMGAMPKVLKELQVAGSLYGQLDGLKGQPVNQAAIDSHKGRIAKIRGDRDAVFAESAKLCERYAPLVADIFPSGDAEKRRDFRRAYGTEMRKLIEELHAGGSANQQDIEKMKDTIDREKYEAQERGLDAGAQPVGAPAAEAGISAAGVLTRIGVKENPVARANIAKAQRNYCYLVNSAEAKPPERVASLDFDPAMVDTGVVDAPELKECWRAQMGYWIQRDVVEAIRDVNDEAAAAARDTEVKPWVGVMPVKDIISVRVGLDYVKPGGGVFYGQKAEGKAAALPPSTSETVFTASASNETYDVLQFTLKLVMDQRDIPKLTQRLSRNTFHTLLRVSYKAVPLSKNFAEKVYGSEPAVTVVMDFETILLGDVFRKWMPDVVCDSLGVKCPREEDGG